MLSLVVDDVWIIVPGKPDTYEDPAVSVEKIVAVLSNPTQSPAPKTTGNATFALTNFVHGSEDPDPLPEVPWTAPYATLYESELGWSDLASTYTVPAMNTMQVYYTATRNDGAKTFHWWDNEEATVSRWRSVHSNLQGRFTRTYPITGSEPGGSSGD